MPRRRAVIGNERTTKCGLFRALRYPTLIPRINRWVIHLSKIYHRGAIFMNLHLLRLLKGENGQSVTLPQLNDANITFYRQCFLVGISDPDNPDLEVEKSRQLYWDDLPRIDRPEGGPKEVDRYFPRYHGDGQAVTYLVGKYQTNFLNAMNGEFFKRQYKMIFHTFPDRQLTKKIQAIVNNLLIEDPNLPSNCLAFIRGQRRLLSTNEPINEFWVKNHPHEVLRYTYDMQERFEVWGISNFSIAPITKVKRHFMTIDTDVLYHLSKGIHKETNRTNFRSKQDNYWHLFFNIKRYGKMAHFTHLVETDGVMISIHFQKPGPAIPVVPRQLVPNVIATPNPQLTLVSVPERIIAFDPGRVTLLEGVEKLQNGSIRRYRITKKQYYHESHMNKSRKKREKWESSLRSSYVAISETTHRTSDIERFCLYARMMRHYTHLLWWHKSQKKYSRDRMDVYIHKRKFLDRFFKSLQPEGEAEPVIAYGSAKFSSTGAGEIAAPTTSLFNHCARWYEVALVDEYNTSKMCNCGCELQKLYRKRAPTTTKKKRKKKGRQRRREKRERKRVKNRSEGKRRKRKRKKKTLEVMAPEVTPVVVPIVPPQVETPAEPEEFLGLRRRNGYEIRGLRWCSTKCRRLISRDYNAALNILKISTSIFAGQARPQYLCRQRQFPYASQHPGQTG